MFSEWSLRAGSGAGWAQHATIEMALSEGDSVEPQKLEAHARLFSR